MDCQVHYSWWCTQIIIWPNKHIIFITLRDQSFRWDLSLCICRHCLLLLAFHISIYFSQKSLVRWICKLVEMFRIWPWNMQDSIVFCLIGTKLLFNFPTSSSFFFPKKMWNKFKTSYDCTYILTYNISTNMNTIFFLQISHYGIQPGDLDNYHKLLQLSNEAKAAMTTNSWIVIFICLEEIIEGWYI